MFYNAFFLHYHPSLNLVISLLFLGNATLNDVKSEEICTLKVLSIVTFVFLCCLPCARELSSPVASVNSP